MRVRGLKHNLERQNQQRAQVAPHAGAWIETLYVNVRKTAQPRRTPCGCVD